MARVRLTERFIAKLTAPTKSGRAEIYWDTGQPGFAVYVSGKKASKVFIVQRSLGQRGGRKRREAIGAVGAITLEDARANALAVLHQLMQGADPRVERKRREAEDITLRTAMQRFFGARPDLSEPTRSRWPYYLERYTKDWLERPLKQITPALLEQRRQAIAAENRAPIPQAPSAQEQCFRFSSGQGQAALVTRVVRTIYNHVARELDWPPLTLRMPKRAGGGRRRVRIIPESRLPRFHAALMQLPRVQRDYLQVLLYTGARRGETAALQWRDIDLEERVIRLRAETTKAKRAAIIPMSSQLHALFVARRALGDRSVFVFPSERRSRTGHLTETNAFG